MSSMICQRSAVAGALVLALALCAGLAARALAEGLPVPSQGLPGYVSGSQEVPDPGLIYKVVFDVSSAGALDKVHPTLARIARYLNVLAEYGVPPMRRQLVVVLDGAAAQFVLTNAAFAARNHGQGNPNAALIDALKSAGVSIRVDAQAVIAEHIQRPQILPSVQVDLWSLNTLVNLQLRGYVRIRE